MWKSITPDNVLIDVHGKSCRTLATHVVTARLDIEQLSSENSEAWSEKLSESELESGQIAVCGAGDPDLVAPGTVETLQTWLRAQGIAFKPALPLALACRGVSHHHDADSYPKHGFCVLWLSEDMGWDLVFPFLQQRIELKPGTVVLFDSAQVHAVLRRGATTFAFEDFDEEPVGLFLSQDFDLGPVARAKMGIRKTPRHGERGRVILRHGVTREELDEFTGAWNARPL